jgi:[protein-PII] uridylyltransferase
MKSQGFAQRIRAAIKVGTNLTPESIVDDAKSFYHEEYTAIHERHTDGESGSDVIQTISNLADDILTGLFDAALNQGTRRRTPGRIALCALGGYGRRELAPQSDLDVCLLYEGRLDKNVRALNEFFVTSLWDIGFRSAYATRSVSESLHLARNDIDTFSSYRESRFIVGNRNSFAKLQLGLQQRRARRRAREYVPQKLAARREDLSEPFRDAYATEPNLKESAGGLRDYHTALWVFSFQHDINSLDEAVSRELITPDEQLTIMESLDFIWHIRNEIHFATGRSDDTITIELQRDIAQSFGYGEDIGSFMSDYYSAARTVRRLYRAARAAVTGNEDSVTAPPGQSTDGLYVSGGLLQLPDEGEGWFAHNPVRLMEACWNCARHNVSLSRPAELSIRENLTLVNDEFRQNNIVRRFFMATCNRPLVAGKALRQAARCGLLGAYLPEFDAVCDVLRYEDFHSYPTDEHTLRAIEAIADLAEGESAVQRCLRESLENLSDPYILIMALLFHDLGKVEGDIHVEASVRITHEICQRIGMPEEDEERITFLVHHHILMTTISQYRDIDDDETIRQFAKTMQTEQRLRALFLLSYADLSAVGPGVWNEWKGALLMRLYLRTVRVLLGRAETTDEEYWRSPKADAIREATLEPLRGHVEDHIQGLGQRYFVAYPPDKIARHIDIIHRAKQDRLVVDTISDTATGTSEMIVCTEDRPGLFAAIAGALSSHLIDVIRAAAFTAPNGIVVDSLTVSDARNGRPLTTAQTGRIEQVLHEILIDGADIGDHMERARNKIFTLLQSRVPIQTRVLFDNDSSSTHTVVDIETGDRTGLLYDLCNAFAQARLDISSSRIVTDARRVRDSFYISRDHTKIIDPNDQHTIEAAILNAIHPHSPDSGVTA